LVPRSSVEEEVISVKKLSVRRLEPVKTSAAVACAAQA
jgi:hypothetical protein